MQCYTMKPQFDSGSIWKNVSVKERNNTFLAVIPVKCSGWFVSAGIYFNCEDCYN